MLRVRYLLGFKDRTVWSIGPEEPVLEAIQLMADKHIGALPVLRGEEPRFHPRSKSQSDPPAGEEG